MGSLSEQALDRLKLLNQKPYVKDQTTASQWAEIAMSSPSAEVYGDSLVDSLKTVTCRATDAPYVVEGLVRQLDGRFEDDLPRQALLAAVFLDEAKCAGARGLSEENKEYLQNILIWHYRQAILRSISGAPPT